MAFVPLAAVSQDLFETGPETGFLGNILLNGYTRSALYLGKYTAAMASEIRSGYGEASLQMSLAGLQSASFYSEIRIRSGYEYNEWIRDIKLREAYADLSLGRFNLRMGQQIIAWGRADGINPTHNITPRDYFVRSSEADDMNMGNFMLRSRYSPIEKIRVEAIWVPVYKYSVYRFDLFETPDYVHFKESSLPSVTLKNGSFAARVEFLFNRFDGSVSWFRGYDPMPGIERGTLPVMPTEDITINMYARAFRQQTLGLDFSSGMGSFGVRGEAALRIPDSEYDGEIFAPGPDLRYVLGIDRTMGDFSFVVMYAGQYVFDFIVPQVPGGIPDIDPQQLQDPAAWSQLGPMMDEQLEGFNRIIFNQAEEISHSLALLPTLSLFHDVLEAEIFGLYNFSTEEWNIVPQITWQATDDLKLDIGVQYFHGPENTMYNMIAPVFNGVFMGMKYTF